MSIFTSLTNMDCNTTITCLRKDASSVISHIGNYQNQISNKFNSIFNFNNLSYLPYSKTDIIRALYIISPPILSFGIGILFTYYLIKNKESQKNQKSINDSEEKKEEESNEIKNFNNIKINDTLQPNSYIESYLNENEFIAKTIMMNKIQNNKLYKEKKKLENEIKDHKQEIRSLKINRTSLEEEIEVLHSVINSNNNKLQEDVNENITENRVNSTFSSTFNKGDEIRLFNLFTYPQFNGKIGIVKSFNSRTSFYGILVEDNTEGILYVSSSKIKPIYVSRLFEEVEDDGSEEIFLYDNNQSANEIREETESNEITEETESNEITEETESNEITEETESNVTNESAESDDTIATGTTLPEVSQEENEQEIDNVKLIKKVKRKLSRILTKLNNTNIYPTMKNISRHSDIINLFRPFSKYSSSKIKIINRIKELITEDDVSDQNKLNIIKHFELLDYYPSN